MKVKNFLEALDKSGGKLLFESGKEGKDIDPKMAAALKANNISYIWPFQPDGYDMVILEHAKDGEKAGSWSVAFMTSTQIGGKEGESATDIYGESLIREDEAEAGFKVIKNPKGNFLETVNLAIDIAGNDKYKQGFTEQNIKALKIK